MATFGELAQRWTRCANGSPPSANATPTAGRSMSMRCWPGWISATTDFINQVRIGRPLNLRKTGLAIRDGWGTPMRSH